MANLPENPDLYPTAVTQLEITDLVKGGADGPSNKPLLELAHRTAYLKKNKADNKHIHQLEVVYDGDFDLLTEEGIYIIGTQTGNWNWLNAPPNLANFSGSCIVTGVHPKVQTYAAFKQDGTPCLAQRMLNAPRKTPWMIIGDFDTALKTLAQRVSQLEQNLATANQSITALNQSTTALSNKLASKADSNHTHDFSSIAYQKSLADISFNLNNAITPGMWIYAHDKNWPSNAPEVFSAAMLQVYLLGSDKAIQLTYGEPEAAPGTVKRYVRIGTLAKVFGPWAVL